MNNINFPMCAVICSQSNNTDISIQDISIKIEKIYRSGVHDFMCSCEKGIIMLSALAILDLKKKFNNNIGLHIVMPFENQADNWSEEIRRQFFTIHEFADSVKILSPHRNASVHKIYTDCNKYIIDQSTCLVTDKNNELIPYALSKSIDVFEFF